MSHIYAAFLAATLFAAPAFAEGHASGDAGKGAKSFNKCKSCHVIVSDAGETIVKGGLVGRTAGTVEGYKYGKSLVAAGEAGLVWDEEQFVAYALDPKKFLQEYLDDSKARSKMSFKLKKGGEDIYAYLASVVE
jgi:cytochrome c